MCLNDIHIYARCLLGYPIVTSAVSLLLLKLKSRKSYSSSRAESRTGAVGVGRGSQAAKTGQIRKQKPLILLLSSA